MYELLGNLNPENPSDFLRNILENFPDANFGKVYRKSDANSPYDF